MSLPSSDPGEVARCLGECHAVLDKCNTPPPSNSQISECDTQFGHCALKCREGADADNREKDELEKLEQKADAGDAEAEIKLGSFYDVNDVKNFGGKRNEVEAAKWYGMAAAGGSHDAQRRYCSLFVGGSSLWAGRLDDMKKLLPEGLKWCHKLADDGDEGAQWLLGALYSSNNVVPKNRDEALKWYIKAGEHHQEMIAAENSAQKGDPDAEYALGRFYECLPGAVGICEMKKWLQLATDHGNWRAQDDLWDFELRHMNSRRPEDLENEKLCPTKSGKTSYVDSKFNTKPTKPPPWVYLSGGCRTY